jgi:uncharacterized protein with PIN domain
MIDSWAILAIVFQKPGAERMAAASAAWAVRRMSTVDWLETLMPSPAASPLYNGDDFSQTDLPRGMVK